MEVQSTNGIEIKTHRVPVPETESCTGELWFAWVNGIQGDGTTEQEAVTNATNSFIRRRHLRPDFITPAQEREASRLKSGFRLLQKWGFMFAFHPAAARQSGEMKSRSALNVAYDLIGNDPDAIGRNETAQVNPSIADLSNVLLWLAERDTWDFLSMAGYLEKTHSTRERPSESLPSSSRSHQVPDFLDFSTKIPM